MSERIDSTPSEDLTHTNTESKVDTLSHVEHKAENSSGKCTGWSSGLHQYVQQSNGELRCKCGKKL